MIKSSLDTTLIDQFFDHVQTRPQQFAVVAKDGKLTYEQLFHKVSILAHTLSGKGVKKGDLVIVYTHRTTDVVVGILSIMLLGATYTVIEDDGNIEVEKQKITNTRSEYLITRSDHDFLNTLNLKITHPTPEENHGIADSLGTEADPDIIAYTLYTSGSSGKPKGVMISHGNISYYVTSLQKRLGIEKEMSYAHLSSLSADLGNTCLFLALWTGGTIHIMDDKVRKDSRALMNYLVREEVDVLKITPSHWNALFEGTKTTVFEHHLLKILILGGEKLTVQLAKETLQSGITEKLINHYGPTETTVGIAVQCFSCTDQLDSLNTKSVPIGSPFEGTEFLVRSDDGNFYSKSKKGELFIGGPSVAKGYYRDEEKTKEAFLTEIRPDKVFYKTGDVVELDESGRAEFIQRLDRQVKLNGHRLELAEVDHAALQLKGVEDAVTFYNKSGRPGLTLVLQAKTEMESKYLKQKLKQLLPSYAIPDRFVFFSKDFPRNANGKLDMKKLQEITETHVSNSQPRESKIGNQTLNDTLGRIWKKCLGNVEYSSSDHFVEDLGGNSLEVIHVISEIQSLGYQLSADQFFDHATIDELATFLSDQIPSDYLVDSDGLTRHLTTIQHWFFNQEFAEPDLWNQSIFMSSEKSLDPEKMQEAVSHLIVKNPVLSQAYQREGRHINIIPITKTEAVFTVTEFSGDVSADDQKKEITKVAENMHHEINIGSGDTFKVHLFKHPDQKDRLLFVAHHLVVDLVSWRSILSELMRYYADDSISLSSPSIPLREPVTIQIKNTLNSKEQTPGLLTAAIHSANVEKNAETIWFALKPEETNQLSKICASELNCSLHHLLLSAFVHAYLNEVSHASMLLDVEGHGRTDTKNFKTGIGWFTEVYQLDFQKSDLLSDAQMIERKVKALSMLSEYADPLSENPAKLCFNFLGNVITLGEKEDKLLPVHEYTGSGRGPENHRIYDLKLSGRIARGQLVADLSFHPLIDNKSTMVSVCEKARHLLLNYLSFSGIQSPLLVKKGSQTGLLTYLPEAILEPSQKCEKNDYQNVFLTGATGFIGAYLLKLMLTQTSSNVYCLVRGEEGQTADERLYSTLAFYFPHLKTSSFADRLTILSGDVSSPYYGLSKDQYFFLAESTEAIYDLAADTRLIRSNGTNKGSLNLSSVKNALRLARAGRAKDVHYVSTLAVSGVAPGEGNIVFSEKCLDVGQAFLNSYEYSKFEAEKLIHQFSEEGGTATIYRAGNVSANSDNGKFRKDPTQNRLIQMLKAIAKVGEMPMHLGEPFVLSAVNEVAEGILKLSFLNNTVCTTYHVDGTHKTNFRQMLYHLQEIGIPIRLSSEKNFIELFKSYSHLGDKDLMLGYHWFKRESRNLTFDHTATLVELEKLGVTFTPFDERMLRKMFNHLKQAGVFEFEVEETVLQEEYI